MADFFETELTEPSVDTTPNINTQLNKFDDGDYLLCKYVPEAALFASPLVISKLKNLFQYNIDIPILVYGGTGVGKLTCIVGLLSYLPCYIPDYAIHNKVNNIEHFKVLDADYNKILFYENIFILNIEILNNNNEIIDYLKYIYQIAKSSCITVYNNRGLDYDEDKCQDTPVKDYKSLNDRTLNDRTLNDRTPNDRTPNDKKIIIIMHIDKCNYESQRYIAFMLDRINTFVSYIFTTHSKHTIDKKIISSCSTIAFTPLDLPQFSKIFKYNFNDSYSQKNIVLSVVFLKKLYTVYIANKYNIGNTIAQIKYYLATEGIEFFKKVKKHNSLMGNIAANFIKKRLVLSNISSSLELRKFLYTLLSLNIKLIIFVKEVITQLIANKLKDTMKIIILEKTGKLTQELTNGNKEIVIVEAFFYDIINILYE